MDPSSGRLPTAHRIILPFVKTCLCTSFYESDYNYSYILYRELELVLTQWNYHRVDYLRPTGLFCLVSKHFYAHPFYESEHIISSKFNRELQLVLTQWNHHRVDYIRPTGVFCLVSKHVLSTTFYESDHIYSSIFYRELELVLTQWNHPYSAETSYTCFDTVEPSLGRLFPAYMVTLPC